MLNDPTEAERETVTNKVFRLLSDGDPAGSGGPSFDFILARVWEGSTAETLD